MMSSVSSLEIYLILICGGHRKLCSLWWDTKVLVKKGLSNQSCIVGVPRTYERNTCIIINRTKPPWYWGLICIHWSWSIPKIADEYQKTRSFLWTEGWRHSMTGWSGRKDQQNKTENFLSTTGDLYVSVNVIKLLIIELNVSFFIQPSEDCRSTEIWFWICWK